MGGACKVAGVYGNSIQIGSVIDRLEPAIEHWVGRFGKELSCLRGVLNLEYIHSNGRGEHLELPISLAFSGRLQIDLIQQHNQVSLPYLSFGRSRGEGGTPCLRVHSYFMLGHRVERLKKSGNHSEWPQSVCSRLISNVRVLNSGSDNYTVVSKFITHRSKNGIIDTFLVTTFTL